MINSLQSKLPDTEISIFAVMSQLAQKYNAINLSQGFPEFPPPIELQQHLTRAVSLGKNQYAPMPGIEPLRDMIQKKIYDLYKVNICHDKEITVTHGATEALYVAITALVQTGDEVILLDPAYDSYLPTIQLSGGIPVRVPLSPDDFSIDWQRLQDAITEKTSAIVINFPHNPSGRILSAEDLEKLYQLIKNQNIYIISDEVYEHLVFDGLKHHSVLEHMGLRERSLALFSFGKTYSATGWKLGYCIAPEYLTNEFRKIHQFVTFTANTPVQYAIAAYMNHGSYLSGLSGFYQDLRDTFCNLVNKKTAFKAVPTKSTIFQLLSYDKISDINDVEFANRLTEQFGVSSIPVSVFSKAKSEKQYLRFCFAKDKKVLQEAVSRLAEVKETLI